MLKACQYCGRIHDSKFDCGRRPKSYKRDSEAGHIRNTARWQRTRDAIRDRDHNLCQLCMIDYEGTVNHFQHKKLSVHHIIKLQDDETKAFDDGNLITLCDVHHEMAESGRVPTRVLLEIVKKQNSQQEKLIYGANIPRP